MKDIFISDDGRPFAEPLLVLIAILLDTCVGKAGFTTFFGWWLFLCAIINIPGLAYGALLMKLQKLDYYTENAPQLVQHIRSHKAFMFCTAYAVFLHYWWRWL